MGSRLLLSLVIVLLAGLLTGGSDLQAAPRGYAGKVTLLQDHTFADALISGIRSAKKSIAGCFFLFKVTSSHGNLPLRIAEELIAARKRGVDVVIELEQEPAGKRTVYEQNRRAAQLLADAGVTVRFDTPKTVTHVKALVVDRRYVYLGSHNLTQSALKYNNELSVLIDSPELASDVTAYLNSL